MTTAFWIMLVMNLILVFAWWDMFRKALAYKKAVYRLKHFIEGKTEYRIKLEGLRIRYEN